MKITITENHIKLGIARNPFYCPIALAMKEELPGHIISVGSYQLHIDGDPFDLSSEAIHFVYQFDKKELPVSPFSFELAFPVNDLTPTEKNQKVSR